MEASAHHIQRTILVYLLDIRDWCWIGASIVAAKIGVQRLKQAVLDEFRVFGTSFAK
jgi:hypothetical protein